MNRTNITHPLNTKHPLAKGLLNAYFGLPQWMDGRTWFDLRRVSNGVLTNAATLGTTSGSGPSYRPNAIKEMRLDGTDDLIALNKTIAHGFGDFTFGIWFRANDFAASRFFQSYSADSGNTFIGHLGSTTTISARDSGASIFNWTVPAMSANVWHHLVITRISAQARCYLNGVESSTGAISSTGTFSTDTIGYTYQPNFSWNGAVDAITIYGRGLSTSEVQSLYKETRRGCPKLFNRVTPARVYTTGIQTTPKNVYVAKSRSINLTDPLNKQHILAKGLVAAYFCLPQWSGGNTWFDLCRRYNGTLKNGPLWTAGNGRVGGVRALSFDGVDDYVDCGQTPALQFTNTQPYTLAVWFKANASAGGTYNIFGYAVSSTGSAYYIGVDYAGLVVGSGIFADYYYQPTNSNRGVFSNGNVTPTGIWHHAVVTSDGSNTSSGMLLYLNGIRITATTRRNDLPATIDYTSARFNIAARNGTGVFPGSIDGAMAWNRALSSAEIAALYKETKAGCPTLFRRVSKTIGLSFNQTPTPTITATKPLKLNVTHPVNKKHPLAIGLKSWWLALPQWGGGATWFDLCRRYNVTLDNTVRWQASYRPGNNRCLNFSTSSGPIGNMGTFSKVTIAMWIRLDVTHGWSISTSLAQGILLDNAQFRYRGFGVDYSTFPTISGGWQNIVVTADSVNINLYMNGVFLGSTAQTNSTEAFSAVILGNKGDGSESFIGLMDDIRIYDRALGSGEVMFLYTNSKEKYKGLLKTVNNFGRIQSTGSNINSTLLFSYL